MQAAHKLPAANCQLLAISFVPPKEIAVLFYYRIDKDLAVGSPWCRWLLSRAPTSLILKSNRTFPPYHPTTRMCLRLMLQILKERSYQNLVDIGCGSGVLALVGLKLGIEQAVAVDIDAQAVELSKINGYLNGLESKLKLIRGSAEALTGCYDLILANLPSHILTEKLPELCRLSKRGGGLVLSGFQDLDKPVLQRALRHHGLKERSWLSADLVFFGDSPTGSFTWMAVHAERENS
jgi:SAM-dependent methyltransferase